MCGPVRVEPEVKPSEILNDAWRMSPIAPAIVFFVFLFLFVVLVSLVGCRGLPMY